MKQLRHASRGSRSANIERQLVDEDTVAHRLAEQFLDAVAVGRPQFSHLCGVKPGELLGDCPVVSGHALGGAERALHERPLFPGHNSRMRRHDLFRHCRS